MRDADGNTPLHVFSAATVTATGTGTGTGTATGSPQPGPLDHHWLLTYQLVALVPSWLHTPNVDGWTPLHCAAAAGQAAAVHKLLELGALPNVAAEPEGSTPLHLAAIAGDLACVSALVKAGADIHAVDARDRTALTFAADLHHDALLTLLTQLRFNVEDQQRHAQNMQRLLDDPSTRPWVTSPQARARRRHHHAHRRRSSGTPPKASSPNRDTGQGPHAFGAPRSPLRDPGNPAGASAAGVGGPGVARLCVKGQRPPSTPSAGAPRSKPSAFQSTPSPPIPQLLSPSPLSPLSPLSPALSPPPPSSLSARPAPASAQVASLAAAFSVSWSGHAKLYGVSGVPHPQKAYGTAARSSRLGLPPQPPAVRAPGAAAPAPPTHRARPASANRMRRTRVTSASDTPAAVKAVHTSNPAPQHANAAAPSVVELSLSAPEDTAADAARHSTARVAIYRDVNSTAARRPQSAAPAGRAQRRSRRRAPKDTQPSPRPVRRASPPSFVDSVRIARQNMVHELQLVCVLCVAVCGGVPLTFLRARVCLCVCVSVCLCIC